MNNNFIHLVFSVNISTSRNVVMQANVIQTNLSDRLTWICGNRNQLKVRSNLDYLQSCLIINIYINIIFQIQIEEQFIILSGAN